MRSEPSSSAAFEPNHRQRRAIGALVIAILALALGWFAFQFVGPGEPKPANPYRGSDPRAVLDYIPDVSIEGSEVVIVPFGDSLKLAHFVHGVKFSRSEQEWAREFETLTDDQIEAIVDDPGWCYELGDVELSIQEARIVGKEAFAEWYPRYEIESAAVPSTYDPNDARIVVAEMRAENRGDTAADINGLFLSSPKFKGAENGSLDHFALINEGEKEAVYGVPGDGFAVGEVPDDWDRIEPGETRVLVIPAIVFRGDFADPGDIDQLAPSDFYLCTFNGEPATQYCLALG